MRSFEKETLDKMQEGNYYENVDFNQVDYIGEFADRVLERSLYLYKHR